MGDVGDRPRAAKPRGRDAELGLFKPDAACDQRPLRRQPGDGDGAVGDRLVKVGVAQDDAVQLCLEVQGRRSAAQVDGAGDAQRAARVHGPAHVKIDKPVLQVRGRLKRVDRQAEVGIGQARAVQVDGARQRIQRRRTGQPQVEGDRPLDRAGAQEGVRDRRVADAADAHVAVAAVGGKAARDLRPRPARRRRRDVEDQAARFLPHRARGGGGARDARHQQREVGKVRVHVEPVGRVAAGRHLHLAVARDQPLDRDARGRLGGG